MKFQKQLEAQLVAEWINAYVNYKQFKKDIKQIREQIASKEDLLVTNKHSASSFVVNISRKMELDMLYKQHIEDACI
ncbi:hypothetical protein SUGI_0529280 [Cryptomeria japonica]|nr:hypothetical protein SUGI_0529280 [Cryptomeria japonica]